MRSPSHHITAPPIKVERASGKAGNGKWKRKMETEMDAENGNGHGIKLAHAHKNSHEVVTVVRP